MNHEKNTLFCDLYDIIGDPDPNTTKEQREDAWQKLLPIEDNLGFCCIIAAKYSWREFSKEYKEKAWQELLKREVKNNLICLDYLSKNAPEKWKKKVEYLRKK